MQQQFVHLRLHSEFSLVDGLIRIKSLVQALPKRGMQAFAITDYCNLFATVKMFQAAVAAGIKPIIGCELPFYYPENPEQIFSLILLCQNEQGYRNLTRLVSRVYQEGQHQGILRAPVKWVTEATGGLIALSGGRLGDIGQALLSDDRSLALQRARFWKDAFFNRFYLEIQRTGRPDESIYNQKVVQLADELLLPLVATNDVRFLDQGDFDAHEARVCIHQGVTLADPKRQHKYSPQQYLRSADEMIHLFRDLPQAIQNTVEICKRCTVHLELGKTYLPNFPTPVNVTVEQYLSELAKAGLEERLQQIFSENQLVGAHQTYTERLQIELNVINSMGFAGYFLIVADFIQWAKQNGVPVGPGRGSGAGSLVAYALKITDLDPLHYELLFERFLNPERVSMPDFDIDFCMDGRDRVIEYVAEKYGRQSVSQIITFGTMAAKAVVRDVGRVLAHPYGFVDKLAKLIPFEIGITLKDALEREEDLKRRYAEEEEVKELIDLALKLEGLARNAGKHAGGVVIAPSQLTDFTAIYCEENSQQWVSQFDKDDVEAVGLVKFDFLGLRTLTIIDGALKTINQGYQRQGLQPIDISTIRMDDQATFNLLKKCQTTAVFQLESRGMKELIHRLQPDCFEEIIALVALFRPGPLQSGMVDDFIDRKHGRARVEYPHPDLEPILRPTYGVILYQEQVMQIAQILANYTLGGADLLRRAMGKKKAEEMAKQRAIFLEGAKARQVNESTANVIFDLMEKFAGYGFNKSHSAAYALIAYQTAWLKAHYPAAFMASVMSADMDNTDKVVGFIHECHQMGLHVTPPAINQSQLHFTVTAKDNILYGLGAIKGVGATAVQCIVQERELHGPYQSLFDLCKRVDLRKISRRVLEALIKSGSLDVWNVDRAILLASVEKAVQIASNFQTNQASQQIDLFSIFEEGPEEIDYIKSSGWEASIRLMYEKETLGMYFSGHPSDQYVHELIDVICPISELKTDKTKMMFTCGLITEMRNILTKRGKKMLVMVVEDAHAMLDVVIFEEILKTQTTEPMVGEVIVLEGTLSRDEYSGRQRMTAGAIYCIDKARAHFAKYLTLTLTEEDQSVLPTLQALLNEHRGSCPVQVNYSNKIAQGLLILGKNWSVSPTGALLDQLRVSLGQDRVRLSF